MTYFAYLDEFGHIGPYVSREDPKHNDSPVFGLAGFVLPSERVRGFGTWFFKRKCQLLERDIEESGQHPARWEKKGSRLYTVRNIKRYPRIRQFTGRLFNKIDELEGFVFYVGLKKTHPPDIHDPNRLYRGILREAIKRIDQFCTEDCNPVANFVLILDDHDQRQALLTAASQAMYDPALAERRRHLIEPPFHLDSHRYQTLQAADWIAGLIGRLGAMRGDPEAYSENEVFRYYFEQRLKMVQRRSGIRTGRLPPARLK